MSLPFVFASGSCRLLCCFDPVIQKKAGIYCRSLHHFNLFWKGGQNFLGKLHTARQHLTLLQFLANDIYLSSEDQRKLLSMSFSSGWCRDYIKNDPNQNYSYEEALRNIRKHLFTDCRVFLFEICSMKNALQEEHGKPVQEELEGYDQGLFRSKGVEECREDLVRLINYVNKTFRSPTIILVGHIRNWIFNPNHPYLDDREQIYRLLVEMDHKYKNVSYVDPAVFLRKEDLQDDWHYDPEGGAFPNIYKKICSLFPPS